MKPVFSLAIVLGFGLVLAAAHFLPWVAQARLPSQTAVVANGGQAGQFLIRQAADRVAATGDAAAGVRAAPQPAAMLLPAQLAAAPLLVEHFKVRHSAGNVIGVAARHWSADARGVGTAWSVLIP